MLVCQVLRCSMASYRQTAARLEVSGLALGQACSKLLNLGHANESCPYSISDILMNVAFTLVVYKLLNTQTQACLLGKNIVIQPPNTPSPMSPPGLEQWPRDVESDRRTSRIQSAKKRHREILKKLALMGVEGPNHASLDCGADPPCTACTCSRSICELKTLSRLIEIRPAGLWDTAPLGTRGNQSPADPRDPRNVHPLEAPSMKYHV